jgi:hypothetical protein
MNNSDKTIGAPSCGRVAPKIVRYRFIVKAIGHSLLSTEARLWSEGS